MTGAGYWMPDAGLEVTSLECLQLKMNNTDSTPHATLHTLAHFINFSSH